jgi:hypothetical protein
MNTTADILDNLEAIAANEVTPGDAAMLREAAGALLEAEARIAASKERIGDLKAIHTRWIMGDSTGGASEVIDQMEHAAYSVRCYLDGIDGPNLTKARAALAAARAEGATGHE